MERHESQRGFFAYELYTQMQEDPSIHLLVGDLGYRVFDQHFADYPDRCINVGASEQAMLGIAVGLALEGKKPFVYSITTFLLRRPYETIKLYLDHEQIPVRLVGSGRDQDYHIDGPSHDGSDAKLLLETLPNVVQYWPDRKEQVPEFVRLMVEDDKPAFISLVR